MRLVENYNKGLQVIVQQNDTQLTISFSRLMTLTLDPASFSFLFVCFLSFCFKVIQVSKLKLGCLEKEC